MLFEELSSDKINYAHLFALKMNEYELLLSEKDSFIVHSLFSDIYSVEATTETAVKTVAEMLKATNPELLLTTNPSVYASLCSEYINSYECIQYVFPAPYVADSRMQLIAESDMKNIVIPDQSPEYIHQLYRQNRILGFYINDTMIGHAVFHIDGTIGGIYVNPDYRRKSYGSAILKASVNYFYNDALYSHVKSDNEASVKMHLSVGAKESAPRIYWMHNRGFLFR